MPDTIHTVEIIQTGNINSYVIEAPIPVRIAIIVVGIKQKEEEPITASVIISLVALSLPRPSFSFSIADSARGVEAFAIPSRLALTQAVISAAARFSLNAFGKTNLRIGDNIFARREIIPLFSKTLIIPCQNAIKPISEITVETHFVVPAKIPSLIPSKFPEKTA